MIYSNISSLDNTVSNVNKWIFLGQSTESKFVADLKDDPTNYNDILIVSYVTHGGILYTNSAEIPSKNDFNLSAPRTFVISINHSTDYVCNIAVKVVTSNTHQLSVGVSYKKGFSGNPFIFVYGKNSIKFIYFF